MSSLSELQNWMAWVITDPRGVDAALGNARPGEAREPERLPNYLQEIVAKDEAERNFRLSVYAEGYYARILEAMVDDYPLLKEAIPEEMFTRAVAFYLKAYPSKYYDIGLVGEFFPKFLSECKEITVDPYVPTLAQVELSLTESFYAPSDVGEKQAQMKMLGEQLMEATAIFSSALRLVASEWNLDTKERENILFLVYRTEGMGTTYLGVSGWKKQIVETLYRGVSLGEAFSDDLECTEAEIQEFFIFLTSSGIIWDFEPARSAAD